MLNSQSEYIRKYSLGDFFNYTVKQISKLFRAGIAVGLIFFIPVSVIMGASFFIMFDAFSFINPSMSENVKETLIPMFLRLGIGYGLMFVGLILYYVAEVFTELMMTYKMLSLLNGTVFSFRELMSITWKKYFGRGFAFMFLSGLILTAIMTAVILVMVGIIVLISVTTHGSPELSVVLIILVSIPLYVLLLAAMYAVIFYLFFGLQAIVFDDLKATEALKKSWNLVKNNWWRVFGISFLVSLIMGFMVSIVITPVMMVAILPGYMEFLKTVLGNPGDSEKMFEVFKMFKGYGIAIGISTLVQSVAYTIIFPAFKTFFYIDLKVRKNELTAMVPADNPQIPVDNGDRL